MIGTRGVPARYGGFETCVEEVGRRLVQRGHEVTVYCRKLGGRGPRPERHLGMRLVYLPALRRKTLETLSHTALSASHAVVRPPEVAVVFNAANAPLLPLLRLRGIPTITHVDGLEWKRAKWGPAGSAYYRRAEALAVRWSDALIADARGIQDYYRDRFNTETDYIPYGAPVLTEVGTDGITDLGLSPAATTWSWPGSNRRTTCTWRSRATSAATPAIRWSWWDRHPTPTSTPRASREQRKAIPGCGCSARCGTSDCWTSSTATP
ncbi:DUF1972 domain-containing protein [Saccharopolyspora spinosa]|uniref:DUF1972 domain-containing protein n=1 Tax=Saccharopolyspora spinosa TaxID=60894 RepID=UPI00376EA739